MRERGQNEGVGAAGAVASGEVGRAPEKYGRYGVGGGADWVSEDTPDEGNMGGFGAVGPPAIGTGTSSSCKHSESRTSVSPC